MTIVNLTNIAPAFRQHFTIAFEEEHSLEVQENWDGGGQCLIQLNLSSTATLGTEESSRCGVVPVSGGRGVI